MWEPQLDDEFNKKEGDEGHDYDQRSRCDDKDYRARGRVVKASDS